MTDATVNANPPVLPDVIPIPVVFTAEDRLMIREIHEAITQMSTIVADLIPTLGNSPIGKMMGLGK